MNLLLTQFSPASSYYVKIGAVKFIFYFET